MKALNFCGGLESGRLAMDRANISVDTYYSAEIDPYAIKIANKRHMINYVLQTWKNQI